jgi:hypothetical protein
MYFNPINVCIIGTLDANPANTKLLTDATITYLKVHKNDDMLRNKAVVWGGTEYPDGDMVHVSKQIITPWNYDEKDLRAVVISNGMIRDYESANTMANRLMQEFPHLTIEKEINIAGTTTFKIGDSINVDSQWWVGVGLVTTHAASFSAGDGFQTNIVLDQRCPRLFGFWKEYPIPNGPGPDDPFDYVYVGTAGAGVWRKEIDKETWENFSGGLGNLSILDLFIKDGTFACVTEDGYLYIRTENSGGWFKYSHGGLFIGGDEAPIALLEEEIAAVACSINESGTIICGYNYTGLAIGGQTFAWVVGVSNTGSQTFADQVFYVPLGEDEATEDASIFDLEAYTANTNIVTTVGMLQAEGYRSRFSPRMTTGTMNAMYFTVNVGDDSNIVSTLGLEDGFYKQGEDDFNIETATMPPSIPPTLDRFDQDYLYNFRIGADYCTCTVLNLNTFTSTKYDFVYPYSIKDPAYGLYCVYQKSETSFSLVTAGYFNSKQQIYSIEYTIEEEHPNAIYLGEKSQSLAKDYTLVGNSFIIRGEDFGLPVQTPSHMSTFIRLWVCNLDSFSAFLYTAHTVSEVWASDANGHGDAGWLGTSFGGGGTIMIPGADSATFMTILGHSTDWWWGGGMYPTRYISGMQVSHQSIKVTKDSNSENVTVAIGGEAIDEYYTGNQMHAMSREDGLTAGGGCLMEFYWFDDGWSTTVYRIYSFNEDGNRVGRTIPVTDEEHLDYGLAYDVGVSGKFYEPVWINYIDIYPNKWLMFRDLYNNRQKIKIYPEYASTPFGTKAYFPSALFAFSLDDGDGTLYITGDDKTNGVEAFFGFKKVGGKWKITKEIIPGGNLARPMPLREYIMMYMGNDGWSIMRGFPGGDPSSTLKHTVGGTFEVLHSPGASAKVEISKNNPIEVYHETRATSTSNADIYQNFSPSVDGWASITADMGINDLRVFDIIDHSTFTVASGSTVGSGSGGNELRWVGIATKEGVRAFPVSLAGDSIMIADFGQPVSKLETTNLNGNPYLFVMTSGVEGSGAGFWQRGQNEVAFGNYSDGLPSEQVTIIRVDERL